MAKEGHPDHCSLCRARHEAAKVKIKIGEVTPGMRERRELPEITLTIPTRGFKVTPI